MIVQELFTTRSDGVKLFRTYSTDGKYIIQSGTGVMYGEAIDVESAPYTYTESNEAIELTAEEALELILGGDNI